MRAANAVDGYRDLVFTCASVVMHPIQSWQRFMTPMSMLEKLLSHSNSGVGLIPSTGAHCLSDPVRCQTPMGTALRIPRSVLRPIFEFDNRLFRRCHQIRCLVGSRNHIVRGLT